MRLGWLAVAVLAVGCGGEPKPSLPAAGNVFRVELSQQRNGPIAAFVHDEAGVVIGVERNDPARNPPGGEGGVIADPASSSLLVSWIGGACHFGPTITLTGEVGDLVVTLRPDEDEGYLGPPIDACDDIGLFFGVRLILAAPIDQHAIDYRVVR